jgi:hypothetical protein
MRHDATPGGDPMRKQRQRKQIIATVAIFVVALALGYVIGGVLF